jgi:hypothetical protein
VKADRRKRGFERAGHFSVEELGLSRKRTRALLLAVAWRRTVGEAVASRTEAKKVHRGVLEVEARDPRTAVTLRRSLPTLAGRLADRYPELGIRKCRLIEGGSERVRAQAVDVAQGERSSGAGDPAS